MAGRMAARRLLVSDLGVDLVWAANDLKLAQQADLFHERKWWTQEVFRVLSQREKKLASAVLKALDRATRVEGPGRRLGAEHVEAAEAERARVEKQFYAAVRAEEHLLTLFEPLDPRGHLWNDELVAGVLDAVCAELVKASDDIGRRAWTHVHTYRANWCAHRVLWDQIEVELVPGTDWDRARVIEAVVAMLVAEDAHARGSDWALARASQERASSLRASLMSACSNLAAVEREARSLRSHPAALVVAGGGVQQRASRFADGVSHGLRRPALAVRAALEPAPAQHASPDRA